MDYRALLRLAERGEIPPILLLHGDDTQLLDDALGLLTRRLFPDGAMAALGREVLDGRETTGEAVVNAALTLPLMTTRRLVVVRNAEALAAKHAGALDEYARAPNPTSCLVLAAGEGLRASRNRRTEHWLLRAVPAAGVVDLLARKGRELATWLQQRAALEGLQVDDEAASLLVEWIGEETATLLGEVRKAALAGGAEGRTVSAREVRAVVGAHRVGDAFDLTRAIERRDLTTALGTLDRLLATEEPVRLCALLSREVRQAWTARVLADRGESAAEIARTLRVPPGVAGALAGLGPASGLARKLERCWDVERRLKSGGLARAELAVLVTELCRDS